IGDLLIFHKGQVGIMELKEGPINEMIAKFLAEIESQNQTINDLNIDEMFDKSTVKQIKRVVRQKERIDKVKDIVNNDEGIDPVSGSNIRLRNPNVPTEYYRDVLERMQHTLTEKIWAYEVVDG